MLFRSTPYALRTYLQTYDNTQSKYVPLELFNDQVTLVKDYDECEENIALKYRQAGVSTVTSAWASKRLVFAKKKNESRLNEVTAPSDEIENMLDEAAEHIQAAIDILSQAARAGRRAPHPFSGQLTSYIIPHLESWIEDENQPGSIATLKRILYNER